MSIDGATQNATSTAHANVSASANSGAHTKASAGSKAKLSDAEAAKKPHSTTLDQQDFMTIMLAQLQYQDPNKPMDDKEMASQLVQYSSLETLNKMNDNLSKLVSKDSKDSIIAGANYMGKSVKSTGYNLSVADGTVSTLYYSLGEPVSDATANIYDAHGSIIRSVSLGTKGKGDYSFVWDGKDTKGNTCSDGTYGVIINAQNVQGDKVVVQSQISGVVTGIKKSNGTTYLELQDGRTVDLGSVTEIVDTANTAKAAAKASMPEKAGTATKASTAGAESTANAATPPQTASAANQVTAQNIADAIKAANTANAAKTGNPAASAAKAAETAQTTSATDTTT